MILTVAQGSLGHYYVDEDGNVYTAHHYAVRQSYVEHGMSPALGERPTDKHQQVGGGWPYWLPTGQKEPERIDDEILDAIADAYERRDRLIAGMDDVVRELQFHEDAIRDLVG